MTLRLVLVVLPILALSLAVVLHTRRRVGRGSTRLRLLLVVVCALAVLDPPTRWAPPRLRAVILDASGSMGTSRPQQRGWILRALEGLDPQRDRACVVRVGGRGELLISPRSPRDLGEALGALATAGPLGAGTDLGSGLRLAAELPGLTEGLLISDGRDTAGDALAAAGLWAALEVPLDAYAPDLAAPRGARVAGFDAPAVVAPEAPIELRVEVRAYRRGPVRLVLERVQGEEVVWSQSLRKTVGPAEPWVAYASAPSAARGVVRLRARVEVAGPDDVPEDDRLERAVSIGGAPELWVVDPYQRLAAHPSRALVPLITRSVAPEALGEALRAGAPDLVALIETPAEGVDAEALERAVRAGTGLVVVGASRAFGPGGYARSGLEEVLPVTSGPGSERARPLQLVVALDASGSMGQGSGGEIPFRVAAASATPTELLRPTDGLAVWTFAEAAEELRALAPWGEGEALTSALEAVEPRGSTDVGEGLRAALATLEGAEGDLLVVLATDARDAEPSRHAAAIRAAAEALPSERLRVVLVLIGARDASALRPFAEAVGPAAVVVGVKDADAALRDVVQRELFGARDDVREGRFQLRRTREDVDLPLVGFVERYAPVSAKAEAEVLAVALDAELEDPPVVALGRCGLGRVAAIPLPLRDAEGPLSRVAELLQPPTGPPLDLRVQTLGQHTQAVLRSRRALDPGGWSVEVVGARTRRVPLQPWTPTELRAVWRSEGAAWVSAVDRSGAVRARGRAEDPARREAEDARPDRGLLRALAEVTGGRLRSVLPSAERPWVPEERGGGDAASTAVWAVLAWVLVLGIAAAEVGRARFIGR